MIYCGYENCACVLKQYYGDGMGGRYYGDRTVARSFATGFVLQTVEEH